MSTRSRLTEVERVAFNTAHIPVTARDEAAHDRLDRLEYRLKYGDAAYADYSMLRSDGLNHAQAARAERTATKRAIVTQEARNARNRDQRLAEQDDAVKDEVIRSLARDVQNLMSRLDALSHGLGAQIDGLEARFNQVTQSEACPCPEPQHLGNEDCFCGGSEC